jgi:hypothetical protein
MGPGSRTWRQGLTVMGLFARQAAASAGLIKQASRAWAGPDSSKFDIRASGSNTTSVRQAYRSGPRQQGLPIDLYSLTTARLFHSAGPDTCPAAGPDTQGLAQQAWHRTIAGLSVMFYTNCYTWQQWQEWVTRLWGLAAGPATQESEGSDQPGPDSNTHSYMAWQSPC